MNKHLGKSASFISLEHSSNLLNNFDIILVEISFPNRQKVKCPSDTDGNTFNDKCKKYW